MRLTGHFLGKDAFGHHHKPLPTARDLLFDRVAALADETCDGRLVAVLEGGYDPTALARSVAAVIRVFDGDVEKTLEPA